MIKVIKRTLQKEPHTATFQQAGGD